MTDDLAARVLRPSRDALPDLRDLLEEVAYRCGFCEGTGAQQERVTCWSCDGRGYETSGLDPREFWELLSTRDVIPAAWVHDERRAFVCGDHTKSRGPCEHCGDDRMGGVAPHPLSVNDALALTADVPGVLTAEALAREVATRLGVRADLRVVWRVVAGYSPPHVPCTGWSSPMLKDEIYSLDSLPRAARRLGCLIAERSGHHAQSAVTHAHGFTTAGASVWDADPARDRAANPWAPLRDLQRTGYWLDAITPEHLVLVCPALDGAS